MSKRGHWDIFCKVIDNYGDVGVCWRLCADLASRGQQVRLWIDDSSALSWMAPNGHPDVEVMTWVEPFTGRANTEDILENFDFKVIIESFGCNIDPLFIADCAIFKSTERNFYFHWINVEYISAESYAERNHLLASPVMTGPAKGLSKHFFYPGFTPGTGGVLRETDLLTRQTMFEATREIPWMPAGALPIDANTQQVSLFCYEPEPLGALLSRWAQGDDPVQVFVTTGRATDAVNAWAAIHAKPGDSAAFRANPGLLVVGSLRLVYLPPLTQKQYDELLWLCDINFVRGEDSLVRAIWAGKPFVWNIYPQDDGVHHTKLDAFLDCFDATPSWAAFHRAWNAQNSTGSDACAIPLPDLDLRAWAHPARAARERLLSQQDLTTQLMQFVTRPTAST